MGMTVLALEPADRAAFDEAAADYFAVEKRWLEKARAAAEELPTRADRAQARQEVRAELARRRASGELIGNRSLMVAAGLRQVLAERGLAGDYEPVPPGTMSRGRPVGDTDRRHGHVRGEGGFKATLRLELPADLEEQLRRAVYWHTWEVIEQLRKWADKWGEAPEIRLQRAQAKGVPAVLAALAAVLAPRATRAALEERERLRAQIVTTGDLLREAVRAVAGGLAQEELPLDFTVREPDEEDFYRDALPDV
ncbi:hypothetical protein OG618_37685 (plasmid) [Kitasatospora sp. NBC_01246]|uniref:hypothetical protein n=1 Tax=Kitasatospora sp. NBC_01246 TaxID=2903570 RepID=UPI002E358555|nr:hypothetical protein [Kitasatospora sp. NBC_01246]